MAELVVRDLGRISYADAMAVQRRFVEAACRQADAPAHLLLCEHDPPVITLGRRGRRDDILSSPEELAAQGIEVHRTARGGLATYHGPGQLVGYPVMRLGRGGRSVRGYVRSLEDVLIELLGRFGLEARRREGHIGVWVAGAKIASIGIAVRRWIAHHGFALNVSTDLDHFRHIVPCGAPGAEITSMRALLSGGVSVREAKAAVVESFGRVFGFRRVRGDAGIRGAKAGRAARLPPWLTKTLPAGARAAKVRKTLERLRLNTVCSEARCPNRAECFASGLATFMILGDVCTRNCRFCAVGGGRPGPPRADEPEAVAEACETLGLRHAVITSVTRDDLRDGGAAQFARTVSRIRRRLPQTSIELLVPDFAGSREAVDTVLAAGPDVFGHNIETVAGLYPVLRAQADYQRSLNILAGAKRRRSGPLTKSGLMVGAGETDEQVAQVMADLRSAGCDILTIGQYLSPSSNHPPVARFVEPRQFDAWAAMGRSMGFAAVAAGPFVRSSYRAGQTYRTARSAARGN